MSVSDDLRGMNGRRQELPVELWLRGELTAAYDGALSERLPEEWLALIDASCMGQRR